MTTADDDMKDRFPVKNRDRLDEIIQEECATGGHLAPALRDVAEACFRHGVERAVGSLIISDNRFSIDRSVQPASAEEKCGDCRAPNCWCSRYNWRAQLHPNDIPRLLHGDSRKGERRNGNESHEWAGLFCAPLVYGYRTGIDHRSGVERRKK